MNQSIGFFGVFANKLNLVNGETLYEVNLPYEPLQDPLLAILYFLIKVTIVIVGEYVHIQILKFLKHETCIVKDVLKTFLYLQMMYWPVKVVFETTTDFIYPLRTIIGKWYCDLAFLWLVFGMTLIVFHSFIVGLMRYTFVVHHQKTLKYGIEEMKNLFYWIAILVPFVITLWGFIARRQISSVTTLNKCYGNHVEAFLVEEDVFATTKKSFCAFEPYKGYQSHVVVSLKKIFCIIHSAIYALMGANVVEGLFYWRMVTCSNK